MGTTEPPVPTAQDPDGRDLSAAARDRASDGRDRAAEARDRSSQERDERAEDRDERAGRLDVDASSDRSGARRDRQGAAGDRRESHADRAAARSDRELSSHERAVGVLDQLTGAYRRETGYQELQREVLEATRRQAPFVLAFIDVDHLKATNDSLGHDAGDRLLRLVVQRIREVVREYDVIVRFGGDEFLCGLADMQLAEAAKRFERANRELADSDHASVTVGLAQLEAGESLADLITRADTSMYQERGTTLE
jgi:diguanylate cyclase (GGDEF)-like protein